MYKFVNLSLSPQSKICGQGKKPALLVASIKDAPLGLALSLHTKMDQAPRQSAYWQCYYADWRYAEQRYAEQRYAEGHYGEWRYAEGRYGKRRYAEWRYAEHHGAQT